MSDPKTVKTKANVADFLAQVEPAAKRAECEQVNDIMREITGCEPEMWGPSIIGYGSYHYVYASGREGDWMATGFSPRKAAITLYIMAGFERYDELMKALGKYKTGKSCLYIKQLSDIDLDVLKELIRSSFDYISTKYPS